MTQTPSKFQLLPSDLKKIIYLMIALIAVNLVTIISQLPDSIVFAIPTLLIIIVTWGLYTLKSWARKITILVLAINAFFAGFSLINFFLGLFGSLSLAVYFGGFQIFIYFVFSNFIYPILVFYLLYLISNENVKQYFDYPEMVNPANAPKKKKEEKKEYRSFSSALDK